MDMDKYEKDVGCKGYKEFSSIDLFNLSLIDSMMSQESKGCSSNSLIDDYLTFDSIKGFASPIEFYRKKYINDVEGYGTEFNAHVKRGSSSSGNKDSEVAIREFVSLLNLNEYILRSEYKGTTKKVLLECPNGHDYYVTPNNFKTKNSRCQTCRKQATQERNSKSCTKGIRKSKSKKKKEEEFKAFVIKENYELLSEYVSPRIKVILKCPNDHEYEVVPYSFLKGSRCKCNRLNNEKSILAKNRFLDLLSAEGYKLKSEYKGTRNHVTVECPNGHEYEVRPTTFINLGYRCKCQKKEVDLDQYNNDMMKLAVEFGL